MNNKNRVVNAGIRLTRNCNMKCMYCNIQNTTRRELTFEEWKQALSIVKDLGAKDVVILGGEPTLYERIVDLVYYISKELKISCSLTTNAFDNFDIIKKLIDVGLSSIGVSVDNLNFQFSISPLKSKNGLKLIEYLQNNCENANIVNYTVLNKNNVESIIDLIKYMNNRSVAIYILPFHWGNEGTFDHRKNSERFAFIDEEDINKYNDVIDKIIQMKKEGYKIKNSMEFLRESKKHIKNLDWKCTGLSELRIDSDGKLVCCCDKIGKVNNQFNIFNLKENLNKFYKMRESDTSECAGCLWPSSFEAELKKSIIDKE